MYRHTRFETETNKLNDFIEQQMCLQHHGLHWNNFSENYVNTNALFVFEVCVFLTKLLCAFEHAIWFIVKQHAFEHTLFVGVQPLGLTTWSTLVLFVDVGQAPQTTLGFLLDFQPWAPAEREFRLTGWAGKGGKEKTKEEAAWLYSSP